MTIRSRNYQCGADLQRHEESPQRHVECRGGLLQVDVRRRKPVLGVHPLKLIVDRCMSDRDTLGSPGRPRGVDHVRSVREMQGRQAICVGDRPTVELFVVEGVDLDHPCPVGQIHIVPRSSHNTRGLRRLENICGAVGWMVGIYRHPGSAGLGDRIQTDHQVQRPADRQSHKRFGPNTHADELTGQTVCAGVEFGVREAGAFENDSGGIGRTLDLTLECFGDGLRGNVEAGAVPQCNLVPLLVGCDREIPDLAARFGRDELLEELHEPRVISLGVSGPVQIGIRLEVDVRTGVADALVQVHTEVFDQPRRQDVKLADEGPERQLGGKHHDVDPRAEESAPTRPVTAANHVLVSVPLMAQCAGHFVPDVVQKILDGGVRSDGQSQRDDVGDHATGPAQHGCRSTGNGQTQRHVLSSGHLSEVRRKRRDDSAGNSGLLYALEEPPEQRLDVVGQRCTVDPTDRSRRGTSTREARDLVEILDLVCPVLAIGFEPTRLAVLVVHLVDVPEIGGLARLRIPALHARRVQLRHTSDERRGTETVENCVVNPCVPVVAVLTEAQNRGRDQSVRKHVDRPTAICSHPPHGCVV
ncbi:hypothetical protein BKP42_24070 [Rhodococcus erythropolis]|nr:hypothetical protein BKP42_24070 [Rhodococcus erythropolis]